MTYAINGVSLTLQPTRGQWMPRTVLGIDGNGKAVYAPYRQFQMSFDLTSQSDFDELRTYFDSLSVTGSLIVDLPRWDTTTYGFRSYTGCLIREPEGANYFTKYKQNVTLLITNIRT